MASIVGYYIMDAEETARESVTDYSADGIAALASAEADGAILRAVYDDGTEAQVTASQVSNPNEGGTGSMTIGASYDQYQPEPGELIAQSDGWTGTLTIGGLVLEFDGGRLMSVS